MFWLISRLLPFALLLLGAFLLFSSLPTVVGGAETASTSVALADVTTTSPAQRWLKLNGGGLYLPDAVLDEQVKKRTGARKVTAYYVPYLTESEAVARAKASVGANGGALNGSVAAATAAPPKKVVLVRFAADDFLRSYPSFSNLSPDDVYRPTDIEGVRASSLLFPERLKDYVRAELKMPLDAVVVIKANEKPLQRGEAIGFAGAGGVIALIGLLWSIARLRRRPAALPMPAPGPPGFPPPIFPGPPLRPTSPPPPPPLPTR